MSVAVATSTFVDSSVTSLLTASSPAAAPVPKHSTSKNVVADPFSGPRTSGAVYPSVLKAVTDTPGYPAGCIVSYAATASPECLIDQYGTATNAPIGPDRVVLLGDSHAGEWYPDVYGVAHHLGWDTEVLTKEGCPLAAITVENAAVGGPYSQCSQWRSNTFQRLLGEPRPRVIFIASLNYYTADSAYLASGWKKTLADTSKNRCADCLPA